MKNFVKFIPEIFDAFLCMNRNEQQYRKQKLDMRVAKPVVLVGTNRNEKEEEI